MRAYELLRRGLESTVDVWNRFRRISPLFRRGRSDQPRRQEL